MFSHHPSSPLRCCVEPQRCMQSADLSSLTRILNTGLHSPHGRLDTSRPAHNCPLARNVTHHQPLIGHLISFQASDWLNMSLVYWCLVKTDSFCMEAQDIFVPFSDSHGLFKSLINPSSPVSMQNIFISRHSNSILAHALSRTQDHI